MSKATVTVGESSEQYREWQEFSQGVSISLAQIGDAISQNGVTLAHGYYEDWLGTVIAFKKKIDKDYPEMIDKVMKCLNVEKAPDAQS